jgi:hypothetical protein
MIRYSKQLIYFRVFREKNDGCADLRPASGKAEVSSTLWKDAGRHPLLKEAKA